MPSKQAGRNSDAADSICWPYRWRGPNIGMPQNIKVDADRYDSSSYALRTTFIYSWARGKMMPKADDGHADGRS